MTEMDYAAIVSKNLKRIAYNAGKTQTDICRDLGIGKSTVSSWFTGDRVPRMKKIDELCAYFHVKRSDIMEPHDMTGIDQLTPAEEDLIRKYRGLSSDQRRLLEAMLRTLTETK